MIIRDIIFGGREFNRGGEPGGPVHTYNATFQDIVPDERIVAAYEMQMDEVRISVSLATTEFRADGAGTRLVYTEQGAFLDGHDHPAQREAGCQWLLGELDAELRREPALA